MSTYVPPAGSNVVMPTITAGSVTASSVTLGTSSLQTPVGSMPLYACRAWINFDGTLGTGVWRAAGNVASLQRSTTGVYVITFATSMPSADYACVVSFDGTGTSVLAGQPLVTKTASAVTVSLFRADTTTSTTRQAFNSADVNVAVFF